MKKKIMGVILAATLIVSQAVTAFAGSKTSEVVLPNDFAAYYTVTEGTREAFAEAEAVSPQTVDAIIEVNNGSMTLAQLVADMKELLKAEGAAGRHPRECRRRDQSSSEDERAAHELV